MKTQAVHLGCDDPKCAVCGQRPPVTYFTPIANTNTYFIQRHKFWGAGERDCPADLKAPNGELRTMRCKVCGDGWLKSVDVCFGSNTYFVPLGDPIPVTVANLPSLEDRVKRLEELVARLVEA